MVLPGYLTSLDQAIVFSDMAITNQSHASLSNNLIGFSGLELDRVNVIIANGLPLSKIGFRFDSNSFAKLHVIIFGSKNQEFELDFVMQEFSAAEVLISIFGTRNHHLKIIKNQTLGKGAKLDINIGIIHSGALAMTDTFSLMDEFASISQNLLNIASGKDLVNVCQQVFHLHPHTFSNLDNKLIASDISEINFDVSGKIEKGNYGSDCTQNNRGLLLGERSIIQVEPKLLIDEFDVFAKHGAAIGRINDDELFYLLSRGLTEQNAKKLIVSGYTLPYLTAIGDSHLKDILRRKVARKIEGASNYEK